MAEAFFIFPPCAGGLESPPAIIRQPLISDCSVPAAPAPVYQCRRLETPLPPMAPAIQYLTTRLIRLAGAGELDETSGRTIYPWQEVTLGEADGNSLAYVPTGVSGPTAVEQNDIPAIPGAGATYQANQLPDGTVIFVVTSALSGYSATVLEDGIAAFDGTTLGSGQAALYFFNEEGQRIDGEVEATIYNDQDDEIPEDSVVQVKIVPSGKLLVDVVKCAGGEG